ncbi:hypothetical protein AB0K18_00945 [Nonomuraea sp. NPDC049421]|uniref:hypothetical protein n=1 Tax=Nonomuraea sp. NPDC049421 TaxID=3155275 RepID=UPI00341FC6FF
MGERCEIEDLAAFSDEVAAMHRCERRPVNEFVVEEVVLPDRVRQRLAAADGLPRIDWSRSFWVCGLGGSTGEADAAPMGVLSAMVKAPVMSTRADKVIISTSSAGYEYLRPSREDLPGPGSR